jgi:hypothetical protein
MKLVTVYEPIMARFHQALLIVSLAVLSWLLMQAVHELGHVLAAWVTGGCVAKVVLHPFSISRTDVEPNPKPLVVVWSGPILGSFIPLLLWAVTEATQQQTRYLWRFFCGFCLLANGLYIGVGSFGAIGDAGDLVRYGSSIWTLWVFGLVTVPAGFMVWNGLGPAFGIGTQAPPVPARLAYFVAGSLLLILIVEFAFFSTK